MARLGWVFIKTFQVFLKRRLEPQANTERHQLATYRSDMSASSLSKTERFYTKSR